MVRGESQYNLADTEQVAGQVAVQDILRIARHKVKNTAGLPQPKYRVEIFMLYATIRNTKLI